MNKVLSVVMVLLMIFSLSYGNQIPEKPDLTESQIKIIQLSADIFSECVIEKVVPFVVVGFTTEWSLDKSFQLCYTEGKNLITEMEDVGLDGEEINTNFQNIYNGMVSVIDKRRNLEALILLKKISEKQKERAGETSF